MYLEKHIPYSYLRGISQIDMIKFFFVYKIKDILFMSIFGKYGRPTSFNIPKEANTL